MQHQLHAVEKNEKKLLFFNFRYLDVISLVRILSEIQLDQNALPTTEHFLLYGTAHASQKVQI